MTSFLDQISGFSPRRLALLAAELKARIDAAQPARVPIAVIGIGCRFPSAPNPSALWTLLRDGRDAVGEVPPDRWSADEYFDPDPDRPGTISVRQGAFLDRVDGFEPEFFGISPREAMSMDPQQRLALEVSWEALEDAGIDPRSLAGSATGVFLGISGNDYQLRLLASGRDGIDAHLASGNAHGIASGRIAYVLGLQGPALSIDTACSASLVALHSAWQSLRSGECTLAIAGGVNVMCAPEAMMAASRSHLMAADGRCKTFDASGDGYGRGEGCGMVVLKRLADAERDGDRVLAVVAGSALNQDGRSTGLTVPNGPAQEAVIRAALESAGIAPSEIDYVEAHGTGTSLGDPIEIGALARVLSDGHTAAEPLLVGSIKTNVGHLESAAGIAGFIKVVLGLQHETIPPHLHLHTPNPHIAWDRLPIRVPTECTPWTRGARVRRAGVSSFGFSGTNAHVIVEEAPPAPDGGASVERPVAVPLSARTESALRAVAADYANLLSSGRVSVDGLAYTASAGRAHLQNRAAVVGSDVHGLVAGLRAVAEGSTPASVRRGVVRPDREREIVFLFTGAGAQYAGMGRGLYEAAPVFRAAIDRCDALLGIDEKGRRLLDVLFPKGADEGAAVHEMSWTQPALFAVEHAMTELWRSWGVEPAAVIGHSTGEYIAAWAAGVFSLEDALQLVAARSRLLEALPPGGAMATVFASAEMMAPLLAPVADRVAIAAINAPDQVVLSGDAATVESIVAQLASRHIEAQRVFVPLAAHSPLVEPALDSMFEAAGRVAMRPPRIPIAWNLAAGAPAPGAAPDALYWRRHMRETVAFASGAHALYKQGFRLFLEVGPHPVLGAMLQGVLPAADVASLASLRRGQDDGLATMAALADLYVRGVDVAWERVHGPRRGRVATLPGYPFERRSFWVSQPAAWIADPPPRTSGPLLGGRRLPTAEAIFEHVLSPASPSWLGDHRVNGAVVVPGPVFVEMVQAGAADLDGACAPRVIHLHIDEPLVLPDEGRVVQVHLADGRDGERTFSVQSRPRRELYAWTRHASGRLATAEVPAVENVADLASIRARLGAEAPCDAHYDRLNGAGIELGPAFRCMTVASTGHAEALALITRPESLAGERIAWSHPVLVDAALQVLGLASASARPDEVALLSSIESMTFVRPLPPRVWCHATVERVTTGDLRASIALYDEDGAIAGTLAGVRLASMVGQAPAIHVRAERWRPCEERSGPRPSAGRHIVVDDAAGLGASVASVLSSAGCACECLPASALAATVSDLAVRLRGDRGEPIAWVIDCAVAPVPAEVAAVQSAQATALRHLRVAQALDLAAAGAGLCLLTRGARVVAEEETVGLSQAAALGLSRTAGMERLGKVVRLDLDRRGAVDAALLLRALEGDDTDLAARDGRLLAARFDEVLVPPGTPAIREDGIYVVAGGSGALGLLVAEWLAAEGAGEIVLLSRHEFDAATRAGLRSRFGTKTAIRTLAVDIGDRAALGAAWRRDLDASRVRGIVHAAGIHSDAPLAEQDDDRFARVARAKIDGGWNLHQLSAGSPVDFFVLFSSAAGWIGTPGQANYAACNAFLDALALHRRTAGLPATVVAWGPWDDARGMAARATNDLRSRWHRQGIGLMPPADALRVLASAIARSAPPLMVAAMNPARFVAQAPAHLRRLFGAATRQAEHAGPERDFGSELRHAATADARRSIVGDAVRRRASRILGLEEAALDDASPLASHGLDSLMAVQLKNAVQRDFAVTIGIRDVLRGRSLTALIDQIVETLQTQAVPFPAEPPVPVAPHYEEGTL